MVENALLEYRMENINPILRVENMSRSLAFYVDILGFTNAEWGDHAFTNVRKDRCSIYLCQGAQGQAGTWVWMGFAGDIHRLHQQLMERGVAIRMEPRNFPWAYEMHVLDPDGHVLRFGTDPKEEEPYAQSF
ncbi:MAG: VOC family protein [Lewinellaceae bacterium]|nr:VOC family protein [Lewinellaceae bacterium]